MVQGPIDSLRDFIMCIFHKYERATNFFYGSECEDTQRDSQVIHIMPVAVSNPVLRDAVQFSRYPTSSR